MMQPLPPAKFGRALKGLEEVTSETEADDALVIFRKITSRVRTIHRGGHDTDGQPKRRRRDLLRCNAYQLGVHYLDCQQLVALRPLFPGKPPRKDVPSLDANLFHWVLVQVDLQNLTVAARNVMAKQLLYAYRHSIPPYLLEGFLHQTGSPQEISRKLDRSIYEPWHPCYHRSMKLSSY